MYYKILAVMFLFMGIVSANVGNVFSADHDLLYGVWSQPLGQKETTIQYARRINGKWQEPLKLNINSGLHVTPIIGVQKSGTIWIVWIEQTASENILRYAHVLNGNIETGRVLSGENEQSYAPAIVIDDNDVPWISWSGVVGDLADIFSTHWLGVSWADPVMVNEKNDVPDITPIMGLLPNKEPWVSWFGFDESRRYVQFFAIMNNRHWQVKEKKIPSKNVREFVQQRIGKDVELPIQAKIRLMGAVFVREGKEIQSISERFITLQIKGS